MPTAYIITLMAAIGLPAGCAVARQVFAPLVLAAACEKAREAVRKFKTQNVYVTPLSDQFRPTASVLRDMIHDTRVTRDAEMETLRKVRIPQPQISLDLSHLGDATVDNKKLFMTTMKKSFRHKFKHAFRTALKEKMRLATAAKLAAAAAGTATAANAADAVTENLYHMNPALDQAYEAVKNDVEKHLDVMDKALMDIFEKSGLLDISVATVDGAKKVGHFIIGDEAVDKLSHAFDFTQHIDSFHISGTALNTIRREIMMVMDGTTSVGEALMEGGTTLAAKAVGIQVGLALDTLTLGLSCGAFTIVCSFAAAVIRNGILDEKNQGLIAEYESLFAQIESHYRSAKTAIETLAEEFDTGFQERVEKYPDISAEETLKQWVAELQKAYEAGLKASEEKLNASTVQALAGIPEKNWVDRVLFIDRHKAVSTMYYKAQREITSVHSGIVDQFTFAVATHAEEAVSFLLNHVTFDTPETAAVLEKMEQVTVDSAGNYAVMKSDWQADLDEYWNVEGKKASDAMNVEAESYQSFKRATVPAMKSIARKVETNRRRMGAKSAPSPQAA